MRAREFWLIGGLTTVLACSVSSPVAVALNLQASSRAVCPSAEVGSARCDAHVVTDRHGNPSATTSPTGYGPVQFQTAYGLTTAAGAPTSQTIGIVDAYDDPRAETDLGVYSAAYGLPACTTSNGCFKKVNQSGGSKYPRTNSGWALEISLDVQVAHAVCPNCKSCWWRRHRAASRICSPPRTMRRVTPPSCRTRGARASSRAKRARATTATSIVRVCRLRCRRATAAMALSIPPPRGTSPRSAARH